MKPTILNPTSTKRLSPIQTKPRLTFNSNFKTSPHEHSNYNPKNL